MAAPNSGACRGNYHDHPNYPVVEPKEVIILNSHGEKLVGLLHETGSHELVIVCHGFRSSKDRNPMVNLAKAFEKEGITAFRFDFAGNSGSEGSFQYGNYRREADDLHAVITYFRIERWSVAAIIGHSKGGNAVVLYASRYNEIPAVVNISGRFNLERGMEGRLGKNFPEKLDQYGFIDVKNRTGKIEYRVTKESLVDRLTTDMLGACQTIRPCCRVLTVHGSEDEMVPVEDAAEFAKHIRNHELQIIEGANHEFTSHQAELASLVLNFVKESLFKGTCVSSETSSCGRADKLVDSRL